MPATPLFRPSRPTLAALTLLLALGFAAALAWVLSGPGLLKPNGEPITADFGIFYVAGRLGAAAYDWRQVSDAFTAAFGVDSGGVSWNYPPPLLLVMTALAALPYPAAALLWVGGGLAAFVLVIRRAAPGPAWLLAALAFPGTTTNLMSGQTGLWVTAALGAGLLLLERRPALAGLALSALALKPNLAVLLPVALVAGGHWRALAAAAAGTAALAVVGLAGFGWAAWEGFFANMAVVSGWGEQGLLRFHRMPAVFAQARQLGLDAGAARALQAVAAVAAAGAVFWAWRRPRSAPLKGAALAAAIPLVPPYAFDYDLALLILPILWLAADMAARRHHPAEPFVPLAAWVAAVLPGAATEHLPLHPGLPLSVALVVAALWRSLRR